VKKYRLGENVVIRPEARGALLFNRELAETAYIDRSELELLAELINGGIKRSVIPLSSLSELARAGMIEKTDEPCEFSLQEVENCLNARPPEIKNSLSAPETLHISLTNACDQECPGCFYSLTTGQGETYLSLEIFLKVLRKSHEARVLQFAFGGGEPLLNPHVLDFVEWSKKAGIVANITTNGNQVNLELARDLKAAGLGQLQVSMDAGDPELNSFTRPNYAGALTAMVDCRKAGLRFGINAMVTRDNFRALPKLFKLAREVGADGVNLLRPKPPVAAGGWLEDVSLGPVENRELIGILRQKTGNGLPVTLDQSMCFLATHRDPEELYYNGVWGCGAGRRFLTVGPCGEVYPCSHYREQIAEDGEFMAAWTGSGLMEEFRNLEDTIKGKCRTCAHVRNCRGCRSVVRELGGGFQDPDPHCPAIRSS